MSALIFLEVNEGNQEFGPRVAVKAGHLDITDQIAWACYVPSQFVTALGELRLFKGLSAASCDDGFWVRGQQLSGELIIQLRSVPASFCYRVLEDGQLVPWGCEVPSAVLPELEWLPIREIIRPLRPVAAFAGRTTALVDLRLVDSWAEVPANVLKLHIHELDQWVSTAASIRLIPLRFATDLEGQTIVHGLPLPSILGKLYREENGIAVPLGKGWEPQIPLRILAQQWTLQPGDLCLWDAVGTQIIRGDQFVACTRSAVRATAATFGGASS